MMMMMMLMMAHPVEQWKQVRIELQQQFTSPF